MKISKREKQFIVFGAGVFLLILFYLLALEPCLVKVRQLKEKLQNSRELLTGLEEKISGKEALANETASLKEEYLAALASVRSLHEYLVEGKEMPDFSEQLQMIIGELDLENRRMTFHPGKDYGVYKETKASINFSCAWAELSKFLYAVENSGHMLFIRSLRLRPYRRGRGGAEKISVSNLELSGFNFSPEIKNELKIEEVASELTPEEETAGEEESPPDLSRYAVISERDLFRKPMASQPPGTSGEAAKVTAQELKLSLRGVLSRGNEYVALIRDLKTKDEAFYQKGELIRDDRVEEVHPDRVVILHQGTRMELMLHEMERIPALELETAEKRELPPFPGKPSPEELAVAAEKMPLPPLPEKGMKRLAKSLQVELGILARELDERMAQRYGLPGGKGLLILRVGRESQAEKARIRRGDIILKINGKDASSEKEALAILAESTLDQDVIVDLKRADEVRTVTIKSKWIGEKLEEAAER